MAVQSLNKQAGFLFSLVLAILSGDLITTGQVFAQSEIKSVKVEGGPLVVKPRAAKARVVPEKMDQRFATGSLVGRPFTLARAKWAGNKICLFGGDLPGSKADKEYNIITIEFPTPQKFPNENYQIRYNSTQALTEKAQTKAPTVTYVALDKTGAVITTTATNGSKSDNQDYAMELKFYPLTKKGELPGFVHIQIGSDPVSDIKGFFYAVR